MKEPQEITQCPHCHSEVSDSFCAHCGLPQKVTKINGQYLLSEIGSVLNFDKGIFFTVRELLLRPGLSIRKFILEDRKRLVKPIFFIIVCSLVYSLMQRWLHFEDGYIAAGLKEASAVTTLITWVSQNYGYANILMAVVLAFWVWIFFRKYGYNFFEILVLLSYVMGIGMLMFAVLGALDSLTGRKVLDTGSMLVFLYISWAIGSFFDKAKKINYVKAFVSYFLGMFTFMFLVIGVGLLVDWLNWS